jgi:hypothetical protein
MASQNPQEYYENEDSHGSYVYVTLEEMVNNFISNYTGDGTILGKAKRSKVIYQFKQGIKKFTMNALKEIKAVELELGDTLDIILPPDYVSYARISYVNPDTGELMFLSKNENSPLATAYLQDHDADILFDDDGFILEGSTYFSELNDTVNKRVFENLPNSNQGSVGGNSSTNFKLDTTQNANGYFNIDTRAGKIHFSSDNAARVIMLEYVSDGLEYSEESNIKVSKMAENALYNFVNYNLMTPMFGVPMYEKKQAEKMWTSEYKNATIALMDIRIPDVMIFLNAKRNWLR